MPITLRTLFHSPAFAATSIATIALAMALAAVVFAVVDGVLFKALPYNHPDRLFHVTGSDGQGTAALAPADIQYLRHADSRIAITSFAGGARGFRHADRPDVVLRGAAVDANFFDVLGQRPLAGGFTRDHYTEPSKPYDGEPAIVSYALWRDRLASDPAVIGHIVDFVDARMLVVGVLPHDFVFPELTGRFRPDVIVPLVHVPAALQNRWSRSVMAVARVDGALPPPEAKARLDAALASRVGEYSPRRNSFPGPYKAVGFRSLEEGLGRTERPLFRAAFAGAALLVLLGCVNVAGLLTARGRDRERELSIRAALGASRTALARLLLGEAITVAFLGAVGGLALAWPLLTVTLAMLPDTLLLLKPPSIDWRVVTFAVGAAVTTMSLVSALCLASVLRPALARGLAGTQTATPRVRSWARATTLAVESAIGLALVVAGSLILASFVSLRAEDPGFERDRLAVLEVVPTGITRVTSPDELRSRQTRIAARIQSSPGVVGVATARTPLLEGSSNGSTFVPPPDALEFWANDIPISGAFFDVTGLRLLDGRLPTPEEIDEGRPIAVISELTARAYWPGRRAVGQPLQDAAGKIAVTVVGVVAEARMSSQAETLFGEIYVPSSLISRPSTVYLMRTTRDPSAVVREVALGVNRDVPGVIVRRAESFETALAKSVRLHRFRGTIFGVTAVAALLLLAVGVAGLVAMGVARRLRELGIRVALGAPRAEIGRMIVVDHLRPVAVGAVLGLLASWWTTKLLSGFLYGIDAHDARVWAMASTALLIVAAFAAWIPAHRASRVDPAVILRNE